MLSKDYETLNYIITFYVKNKKKKYVSNIDYETFNSIITFYVKLKK